MIWDRFGDVSKMSIELHPALQDQRICIRPARGYCTIGFAAAAIDATFGISGANAATAIVSK